MVSTETWKAGRGGVVKSPVGLTGGVDPSFDNRGEVHGDFSRK